MSLETDTHNYLKEIILNNKNTIYVVGDLSLFFDNDIICLRINGLNNTIFSYSRDCKLIDLFLYFWFVKAIVAFDEEVNYDLLAFFIDNYSNYDSLNNNPSEILNRFFSDEKTIRLWSVLVVKSSDVLLSKVAHVLKSDFIYLSDLEKKSVLGFLGKKRNDFMIFYLHIVFGQ